MKATAEGEVRETIDVLQSSVLEMRRLLTRLGFKDLPPTNPPLDQQVSQIRGQLRDAPPSDSSP